jgi:hypothetical protein
MKILVIGIVLALFAIITSVKGYRRWRAPTTNSVGKFAICIIAVGVIGFVEPFWIRLFPHELLDRFELPNTLEAVRLTAPDGRVFIVSPPILRLQRYAPEGFEKGFLVGRKVSRPAIFGVWQRINLLSRR